MKVRLKMWNEKEKAEYEKQVAEFLKKGGKITKCEIGERSDEGKQGAWGKKPAQKKENK